MNIFHGDNQVILQQLIDQGIQVDAVVTDPPYGLSMNKKWDYDVPSVELWKLVYEVLKPGGHVLSFGGTRTYHRMVVNMEDAGFEIRDQIVWLYGSGFPKSLNVIKSLGDIDTLECKLQESLKRVSHADRLLQKNETEIGTNTQKRNIVQNPVLERLATISLHSPANVGDNLNDLGRIKQQIADDSIAQENAEVHTTQLLKIVKSADSVRQNQNPKRFTNISIVPCDVKEFLSGNMMVKNKVEEVLKTFFGKKTSFTPVTIDVAIVGLINDLKLIILNQYKTILNCDTTLQTDNASAINAIITASIMEHLIGNMGGILKNLLSKYEGWGTALKPAVEPIVLARKPLDEATIAANVLKHGTGGLNIDATRVESGERPKRVAMGDKRCGNTYNGGQFQSSFADGVTTEGRWPANVLLDEETAQALDDQTGITSTTGKRSEKSRNVIVEGTQWGSNNHRSQEYPNETGGASRFFYCAKTSKKERRDSKHPTVKPLALMRYLCRLITPPKGTILDPFAGSGSTGEAAILEGFDPILIEREAEYIADIEKRMAIEKKASIEDLFE